MPKANAHSPRVAIAIAGVLLMLVATVPMAPSQASAVSYQGQPATTVVPDTAGSTAVYEFGRFRTANKENVTGCSLTFPAGTDVSAATAIDPPGTLVVSGQTVTITFTDPVVPARTTFYLTIGNVVSPPAGDYNAGNITMYWLNTQTNATGSTLLATGDYTIIDPYISMTITTPDLGQAVAFGAVDPGVTSGTRTVTVVVDSSSPYDIIRTPDPAANLLGLLITGDAVGPKPQGIGTFTDTYSINPPWDTDPSVPIAALVTYTVVQ